MNVHLLGWRVLFGFLDIDRCHIDDEKSVKSIKEKEKKKHTYRVVDEDEESVKRIKEKKQEICNKHVC